MGNQNKAAWIGVVGAIIVALITGFFTLFGQPTEPPAVISNTSISAKDNGTVTTGNNFDQHGQQVEEQNNAKTINISAPFEQYKTDLAEKEKEIRQLRVNAALSDKDKTDLKIKLATIEKLRADEKASYQAYIKDLQEWITRLDQLAGQVPNKLIEDARQALIKGDKTQAEKLFKDKYGESK